MFLFIWFSAVIFECFGHRHSYAVIIELHSFIIYYHNSNLTTVLRDKISLSLFLKTSFWNQCHCIQIVPFHYSFLKSRNLAAPLFLAENQHLYHLNSHCIAHRENLFELPVVFGYFYTYFLWIPFVLSPNLYHYSLFSPPYYETDHTLKSAFFGPTHTLNTLPALTQFFFAQLN